MALPARAADDDALRSVATATSRRPRSCSRPSTTRPSGRRMLGPSGDVPAQRRAGRPPARPGGGRGEQAGRRRAGEADARTTLGTAMVAAGHRRTGPRGATAGQGGAAHWGPAAAAQPAQHLRRAAPDGPLPGGDRHRPPGHRRGAGPGGREGVRHLPGGQRGGVDAGHRRVVDRSGPARRRGDPRTHRRAIAPTSTCCSRGCTCGATSPTWPTRCWPSTGRC